MSNILLLEDHLDTAEVLTIALTAKGHIVSCLYTLEDTEKFLRSNTKDINIAIIDWRIDYGSVESVIPLIMEKLTNAQNIIIQSGQFSAISKVKELNIKHFFFKPYNIDELVDCVETMSN